MTAILHQLIKLNSLIAGGVLITFGLFYLMQAIITVEVKNIPPGITVNFEDIVAPVIDLVVVRDIPKPEKPLVPEELPKGPEEKIIDPSLPPGGFEYGKGFDEGPPLINEEGFLSSDANAVAIVQVAPVYPSAALDKGIEGYVVVEFDVDEKGQVLNARVLYAEPPQVFDRAALKALERWRYQPKVVDGREVRLTGLQHKMTFTLKD